MFCKKKSDFKSWGGQFNTLSPLSKSWGEHVPNIPPLLRPCSQDMIKQFEWEKYNQQDNQNCASEM